MLPAAGVARMAAAMRLPETFADVLEILDQLGMFHMDLGLGRMETAVARLRLGQTAPVIHVVGTNGKGSTANYCAALAMAHGRRVGLYVSPHLVDVRERILVDGRMLPKGMWVEAARAVLESCADLGLTYFELVTLMAVWSFRRLEVDVMVLEAGLGGTYDATCVFAPSVVLLTPVGLDHQRVLGPTLVHIARDKAGAVGRCPAIAAPQAPQVLEVVQAKAAQSPWPVWVLTTPCQGAVAVPDGPVVDASWLPGQASFQVENAALAVAGWMRLARRQAWPVDEAACRRAVAGARWPGRLHQDGNILVDGAHNTMGLLALDEALGSRVFSWGIFQSMRDKELDAAALARVRARCRRMLVPELRGVERAWPAADLARMVDGQPVASVAEAVRQVAGASALVFGSLYLVGAYFASRGILPVRAWEDGEL